VESSGDTEEKVLPEEASVLGPIAALPREGHLLLPHVLKLTHEHNSIKNVGTHVLKLTHKLLLVSCSDSSQVGYSKVKANTMVFKWVFGPLERG
jgi:hypothetical protein